MQKLLEIQKLAEIEAAPMGLTVVDTKLSQQGKRRTLEVTICRKGGRISLSDCEELSRKLDKTLEEHVPPIIEGSYMLEVQSPGLDRQLKTEREFEIFLGEQVEVSTKESIPALGVTFIGTLQSKDGEKLVITAPKPVPTGSKQSKKSKAKTPAVEIPESVTIEWTKVAQVRLHPPEPAPFHGDEEQAESLQLNTEN
jgi:ribosome maturation factor RimP